MGATSEGKKELIAVSDGYRESEQSWTELLLDLQQRGLSEAPLLAVGDGALGFWAALERSSERRASNAVGFTRRPTCSTRCPRACNPGPKPTCTRFGRPRPARGEPGVRSVPGEISSEVRRRVRLPGERSRRVADVLRLPGRALEAPGTTNPIESTFSTIRLRHRRTKGSGTGKRAWP